VLYVISFSVCLSVAGGTFGIESTRKYQRSRLHWTAPESPWERPPPLPPPLSLVLLPLPLLLSLSPPSPPHLLPHPTMTRTRRTHLPPPLSPHRPRLCASAPRPPRRPSPLGRGWQGRRRRAAAVRHAWPSRVRIAFRDGRWGHAATLPRRPPPRTSTANCMGLLSPRD